MSPEQVRQAALLLANPDCDVAQICRTFGVHQATLYRAVKGYGKEGPLAVRRLMRKRVK